MPTVLGRTYQLQELQTLWGPLYEAVLNILGGTGVILPFGDPKHGQPNASTFNTVGEEQVAFTWSEPPRAFASGLDLTASGSYEGIVPVVSLNGVDEEADSPSAAYWQAVAAARSMGAWIRPDAAAATRAILTKYDSTTGTAHREWEFLITTADKLQAVFHDDSVNKAVYTTADAALTEGIWSHVATTYDGSNTAAGIDLYVNGALVASTDGTESGFVAVEAKDSLVRLGFEKGAAAGQYYYPGLMAGGPLGPFFVQTQLTADQLRRLYEVGRRALAL